MILIVAHHYVVNSGLMSKGGPIFENIHSPRSLFLLIVGAFGKTGINCFLLITGYFMCKSNISLKKFLKLYGEICFYKVIIWVIFISAGYETFSVRQLIILLLPFFQIGTNFIGCFMAFWLCIPFLNILIKNMKEKQHIYLTSLLLIVYTGLSTLSTFYKSSVTMNYLTWFFILYLISSYIRLYPKGIFDNTKLWGLLSASALIISIISIVSGIHSGEFVPHYFLSDSNKILAVWLALSSFMFFKGLNIPYNRVINAFGASTFGVLLIHANSDAMRQWLWKDTLNNIGAYSLGKMLILHFTLSVLGVYLICSVIDMLRIHFIEKPFLNAVDRIQDPLIKRFKCFEKKVCTKLNISDN